MDRLEIEIEIIILEASDMLARVQVRPSFNSPQAGNLRVTGNIHGPVCEKANTLPTDFSITDNHDAPHPQGVATLVDPCYWTPELPMMYEVVVQLVEEGRVVGEHRTTVGIRRPAPRE